MVRLKAPYILPLASITLAAFAKPAIINEVSETLKAEEGKAPLLLPSQIITNEAETVSVILMEKTAETSVTNETDELISDDGHRIKVHVKYKDGSSIPVANVLILDKSNRIVSNGVTDENGNTELRIPKEGKTLQVSYIGFNTFNQRVSHLAKAGLSASIDVELVLSTNIPTIMVIGNPIPADTAIVVESLSRPSSEFVMDKGEVYSIIESMPEFEGGPEAMIKHITNEIRYTELALMYREEARVTVEFIIDKNGLLLVPRVIEFEHLNQIPESTDEMANKGYIYALERKTAHEDVLNQFKAKAKRVVRTLAGKWTPGTQNGKPVNCKVRIPLAFRLGTTVSQ